MPGAVADPGILTASRSIDPANRRANGTVNGTGVDLLRSAGRGAAIVYSDAGTGTTPNLAISLQDSADDSTYAAVASGVLPTAFTDITTSASLQLRRFGQTRATRRYVRVVGTTTGAAGGGHVYCALVVHEARPTLG